MLSNAPYEYLELPKYNDRWNCFLMHFTFKLHGLQPLSQCLSPFFLLQMMRSPKLAEKKFLNFSVQKYRQGLFLQGPRLQNSLTFNGLTSFAYSALIPPAVLTYTSTLWTRAMQPSPPGRKTSQPPYQPENILQVNPTIKHLHFCLFLFTYNWVSLVVLGWPCRHVSFLPFFSCYCYSSDLSFSLSNGFKSILNTNNWIVKNLFCLVV